MCDRFKLLQMRDIFVFGGDRLSTKLPDEVCDQTEPVGE